ncbi:MAG: TIGR02710 family CRISPR-associated CARF protein, partial [Deltaproteobacteria bacterium]|nr:TIGR02710 family CRISPR-associated CARF protein [Deltaproteobacteria bacterium]
MAQTLIISVGSTIEPIVVSIAEHRPDFVIFFASEQTIESIGAIKARLQEQNVAIRNRNVMIADAEDLEACYASALQCAEIALEAGRQAADVVVDFTGGTKAMTAALTLATVGKGFAFSYVGGRERSKEGRGVVTTGSERIVRRRDPFVLYAVHERRRLAQYVNRYQFQAAEAVARDLQARPIFEPDRVAFEFIGDVAAGYEAWDRFLFDDAQRKLKSASRKWAPAIRANPALRYAELQPMIEAHVIRLELIQDKTHRLRQVHALLAEELLANAARRSEEGKYDDAIVRLYRALELGGQIAVQKTLGCGTDKVPVERLPASLRDEYQQRYQRQPNFVQLALDATYRLLEALDQPEGKQFASRAEQFRKIQSARNGSWLAHGLGPCHAETYESLS